MRSPQDLRRSIFAEIKRKGQSNRYSPVAKGETKRTSQERGFEKKDNVAVRDQIDPPLKGSEPAAKLESGRFEG